MSTWPQLDVSDGQRLDLGPLATHERHHGTVGAQVLNLRSSWRGGLLALQPLDFGGLLGHVGGPRRLCRRSAVSSSSTPQKKASSSAACSNGILVPSRVTPSASVALNSPGSSSRSSSKGKRPAPHSVHTA